VNVASTSTFALGSSAGVVVERGFSPAVDFTRDYEVFDEQRSATYVHATRTKNRAQVVEHDDIRISVTHLRRSLVSIDDLELVGGEIHFGDTKIEVPQKQLGREPDHGDKIIFDDGTYTVFAFNRDDMAGLYICWSRK